LRGTVIASEAALYPARNLLAPGGRECALGTAPSLRSSQWQKSAICNRAQYNARHL